MKIQMKDFKRLWTKSPSHRGVVVYGQEPSAVSLMIQHMVSCWAQTSLPQILTFDAQECLSNPQKIFEQVTTQDLFRPNQDYVVHIEKAGDKAVGLLNDLMGYPHVTVMIEAFGLPSSSALVRWATAHATLMAIPLYQDGIGWETLVPLSLTANQAKTLQSLSQHTHESLDHICQKLQYFMAPATSLTEEIFRAFIDMHDVAWQLEGFVGEAIQRPDVNVIGLSRLLFSDCYRHMKPHTPQWGKQRSFFEHMATLTPQAQTRILGHFLTSEAKSMHHTSMPLCTAFKPVVAYHVEHQLTTGHLDPSGIKDVVSIRLCT